MRWDEGGKRSGGPRCASGNVLRYCMCLGLTPPTREDMEVPNQYPALLSKMCESQLELLYSDVFRNQHVTLGPHAFVAPYKMSHVAQMDSRFCPAERR